LRWFIGFLVVDDFVDLGIKFFLFVDKINGIIDKKYSIIDKIIRCY